MTSTKSPTHRPTFEIYPTQKTNKQTILDTLNGNRFLTVSIHLHSLFLFRAWKDLLAQSDLSDLLVMWYVVFSLIFGNIPLKIFFHKPTILRRQESAAHHNLVKRFIVK